MSTEIATMEHTDDGKVIRIDFAVDKARIEELRRRRLIREQQEEFIDLESVGPGEVMVGVLTDEEREIYTEIVTLDNEVTSLAKEFSARSFEMVADAMRKSEKETDLVKNLDKRKIFPNREEANDFFAMASRLELLRAMFYHSIRDRYGHDAILGVRTGFHVVRVRYKYELPEEIIKEPEPDDDAS